MSAQFPIQPFQRSYSLPDALAGGTNGISEHGSRAAPKDSVSLDIDQSSIAAMLTGSGASVDVQRSLGDLVASLIYFNALAKKMPAEPDNDDPYERLLAAPTDWPAVQRHIETIVGDKALAAHLTSEIRKVVPEASPDSYKAFPIATDLVRIPEAGAGKEWPPKVRDILMSTRKLSDAAWTPHISSDPKPAATSPATSSSKASNPAQDIKSASSGQGKPVNRQLPQSLLRDWQYICGKADLLMGLLHPFVEAFASSPMANSKTMRSAFRSFGLAQYSALCGMSLLPPDIRPSTAAFLMDELIEMPESDTWFREHQALANQLLYQANRLKLDPKRCEQLRSRIQKDPMVAPFLDELKKDPAFEGGYFSLDPHTGEAAVTSSADFKKLHDLATSNRPSANHRFSLSSMIGGFGPMASAFGTNLGARGIGGVAGAAAAMLMATMWI